MFINAFNLKKIKRISIVDIYSLKTGLQFSIAGKEEKTSNLLQPTQRGLDF